MTKRNASLLLRVNDCISSINSTVKDLNNQKFEYDNIIKNYTINGFEGDLVVNTAWIFLPRKDIKSIMVLTTSIRTIYIYPKFRQHGLCKTLLNKIVREVSLPVWISHVHNDILRNVLLNKNWIRISTLSKNPEIAKLYNTSWIQPNFEYKTYMSLPENQTVPYMRSIADKIMQEGVL